ncbi:MAG: Ig-like domain-containing protein [Gemmatimonadetes bacterium]|nr:Ig-like domain-containing protein [Gemmatimonadota bacterium]
MARGLPSAARLPAHPSRQPPLPRSMTKRFFRSAGLAGVLLALAACSDRQPLGPTAPAPAAPQRFEVSCTASVSRHTVSCGTPASTNGARSIITGGQGQYVHVTSSNITVQADTFAFDVTVQNLIPQSMGTTDGVTLDPAGVRVFFQVLPVATAGNGNVSVANADGVDAFTSTGQPYFQYNEVLAQNQTSQARNWKLQFDPGVDTFAFTVFVSAQVQYPTGYVELSPATPNLLAGGTQALTATVRTAVGNAADDQSVTWATTDASVATVDASGNVTAVAPGHVTITATSGTKSGGTGIDVCPNLALGQAYTATMPGAASLCFAGGSGGAAEYTYMPVNLSTSSALSLSVTGTGIQAVTGPPSPDLAPAAGLRLASATESDLPVLQASSRETGRLMGSRAARISQRRAASGLRASITPGVPALGDLMSLNVAQGCSGTPDLRTGKVRTVSQHAIIVSDTMNPAGGFTTAQYDSIALEFDTLSYPVDSTNFGAPTDVDSNGRIVLFYTRAVNELSPPATSVTSYGYFTNRDVFSPDPVSGCQRSNAGEILYMMVPDPTGAVNSNVRTVSTVRGNGSRTAAHELQHLINAFRRVYVTGATSFEDPWLDEGLSQAAEELMFYRTAPGLAPRSNIILSNLNTGPSASRRVAAYNTYQNNNFTLFRYWLQRPDTTGAFVTTNPSGNAFRGVLWAFLRYSADRVGGSEPAFWQSLVSSNLTGKANLQNAIGADPDAWLRDFTAAMYADDNTTFTVAAAYRTPSWNYRSVYGGLGGFPLLARPLTNGSALTLAYSRGGGTAYTRFGVPAGGFATVTARSGGTIPTSPYGLIVVRTK